MQIVTVKASVNAQMCTSDSLQPQMMHYKFIVTMTHNKRSTNIVAETFVTVTCNRLSNIFRHCAMWFQQVMKRNHKLRIILLETVLLKALSWKLICYEWFLFIKKVHKWFC